MQNHTTRSGVDPTLQRVTAATHITFLIKESEVMTGRPGRIFIITGERPKMCRLVLHNSHSCGDGPDSEACSCMVSPWMANGALLHEWQSAIEARRLFTPVLDCSRTSSGHDHGQA